MLIMKAHLKLFYQNVRGLRTKSSTVFTNMSLIQADIFLLTETWFNNNHLNPSFFPEGFQVERRDRDTDITGLQRGGGVCAVIDSNIRYIRRLDLECLPECLWLEITCSGIRVLLGLFYISNLISGMDLSTYFNYLCTVISSSQPVIFIGDFNCPDFYDNYSVRAKCLNNVFNFFSCVQSNNECNAFGRILDFCCPNFEVVSSLAVEPLVPEDPYHPSLFIEIPDLSYLPPSHNTHRLSRNYSKGDYIGLHHYLTGVSWDSILNLPRVHDVVDSFSSTISDALDLFIPPSSSRRFKYPLWFSFELKRFLRLKNHYHKLHRKTGGRLWYNYFSIYRRLSKKRFSQDLARHNQFIGNSLKKRPSTFWRYVKSFRPSRSSGGDLVVGGDRTSDLQHISQTFADYFNSVFVCPSSHNNSFTSYPLPNDPVISLDMIRSAIAHLRPSFSSGTDTIPAFIVKSYSEIWLPLLHKIFNRSLCEGIFPVLWNEAIILPLHKSGSKTEVANFRPISLCNNFSKVFEKCMIQLVGVSIDRVLLDSQHGFRKGRSTVTNLCSFLDVAVPQVLSRGQVDCVYFDFVKAFDRVPHDRLLFKLTAIPGLHVLGNWFRSYLSGRKCFVRTGGHLSLPYCPTSGVHQGSNLGPLLFAVFVNDIAHSLRSHHLLFADDLKVFAVVKSIQDCHALQASIDAVSGWASANGMEINLSKSSVISFSRSTSPLRFDYRFNGELISRSDIYRDLGVWVDRELRFKDHIERITSGAYKTLGLVSSLSRDLSPDCYLRLYCSLVRTSLEYASPVWNELFNYQSHAIENIQRLFIRIYFRRYCGRGVFYSYEHIMSRLNLHSLMSRREAIDTLFSLKVLSRRVKLSESSYSLSSVELVPPSRRRFRVLSVSSVYSKLVVIRGALTINAKCIDEEFLRRVLLWLGGQSTLPPLIHFLP